jgi:sigma-B regulation protein RsbU (phosphoserine phosphatase)
MLQILIIDDDLTVQLTLTRILEKQGFQILIASDGAAGLPSNRFRPALIIL